MDSKLIGTLTRALAGAFAAMALLSLLAYAILGPVGEVATYGVSPTLWGDGPSAPAYSHDHEGSEARHLRSNDVSRLKYEDHTLRVCDNSYLNGHAVGRVNINGNIRSVEDANGAADGCSGISFSADGDWHDVCPSAGFDCSANSNHLGMRIRNIFA